MGWEITTPQITVAINTRYGTFLKLIYIGSQTSNQMSSTTYIDHFNKVP